MNRGPRPGSSILGASLASIARSLLTGGLLGEGLRASWSMRSHRWWSKPPHVPVPNLEYRKWRTYTAYGDPDAAFDPADLRSFLRWRQQLRRSWQATP